MEANTFIPLFTFILEVEENNDGAKDNDANPIDSIVTIIENYLLPKRIPLGVTTKGDFTITLGSGKVFGLKQQAKLKQKKLGYNYIFK